MNQLPSGTLTLLFSDIEGSTKMLHDLGSRYQEVLDQHRELIRDATRFYNGLEVSTQGDSFFIVFPRAMDAVKSAVAAQQALVAQQWPQHIQVLVRMGLHTGEPTATTNNYLGMDVHRAARIMSAAHGGQILLSHATYTLVASNLAEDWCLRDLGEHNLKDLPHPEHLYQLIAPGLRTEFPPLRTINNRPNNLPSNLTPLLGREKEVAASLELLRRDDVPLLTFTGPGGTGKTRLSLHLAGEMLAHCEDGAFFVPLAPLSDASLVGSTIAQTLGIREHGGQPILATLKAQLREKSMLLVLDNFEHVVAAASIVGELLTACQNLKVLVSSRIALNLRGEQEFPVPTLALPGGKPPPSVESLSQYSAVQLFIARAQSVKPNFEVNTDNAPAIAEICVRMDGLPLAIELAAARSKLLSPQAMLTRLENRLGLLTGGARDLPERQQTLRNLIAWSYDLLDENERVLLQRLAVFSGGCGLDAAESVCNAAGDLEIDIIDGVSSLLAKNLLRQEEDEAGEPRCWMLETIREFAWEQLDGSGQKITIQQHHAAFYLELIRPLRLPIESPEKYQALQQRIEREQDNLRAAAAFALEHDTEIAYELIRATYDLWLYLGQYEEGRSQLERSLQYFDDPSRLAHMHYLIGRLCSQQSDLKEASRYLERGVELARAAEDKRELARSLTYLSSVHMQQGNARQARTLMEEALTLRRDIGDKKDIATAVGGLAMLALEEGDLENARLLFEESLGLIREVWHQTMTFQPLCNLGLIARYQGNTQLARAYLDEALAVQQTTRNKEFLASILFGQGWVARDTGRWEDAESKFQEMLGLAIEIGHKRGIINGFNGLASVALGTGRPRRGAVLLAAGDALLRSIGGVMFPCDRPDYDRDMAAARAALGEAAFDEAWREGRNMMLVQAIQYAQEESTVE